MTRAPREKRAQPTRLSSRQLTALVAEAIIDAYDESEQRVGFLTMLEEHLACPFTTAILGTPVQVERVVSTTSTRSSPSVVAGGNASSFRLSISRCPHLHPLAGSGLRHTATGRDTTGNPATLDHTGPSVL